MSRLIGTIDISDNVNSFVDKGGIVIPSARAMESAWIPNRLGRSTHIKEEYKPIRVIVNGYWLDTPGTSKYFWDFEAALLSQQRVNFTLGNGRRFEMVDVEDVVPKRVGGANAGTTTPTEMWAYSASILSYEPFTREVAPTLQNLGALNHSLGTSTTNLNVTCQGGAPTEPTWQFTLVVPNTSTVTQVKLQNTTSGEICTVNLTGVTNGTWYLLMDASGASVPVSGIAQTPSNTNYGLLAATPVGYGCTLALNGGGTTDQDMVGRIPTLIPSTSPTIPLTPQVNAYVASITATGADITSANLSVLAPGRWYR